MRKLGNEWTVCLLCNIVLKHNTNFTKMWGHLRSKHYSQYMKIQRALGEETKPSKNESISEAAFQPSAGERDPGYAIA